MFRVLTGFLIGVKIAFSGGFCYKNDSKTYYYWWGT
jgi:hypothetical protein